MTPVQSLPRMQPPPRRSLPRAVARVLRDLFRADARADLRCEWRRRLRGEPALPEGARSRVLVLCHGNICRSPFAAALLAHRDPALEVRSGGIAAGEGVPVDPQARAIAARWQLDLTDHRARPLTAEDVEWAELLLVMQGRHVLGIAERFPEALPRVRLLGDFHSAAPHAIADPWRLSDETFVACFEQIERAVDRVARLLAAQRSAAPTRRVG
jgi:protein-tyrosine phosphatase